VKCDNTQPNFICSPIPYLRLAVVIDLARLISDRFPRMLRWSHEFEIDERPVVLDIESRILKANRLTTGRRTRNSPNADQLQSTPLHPPRSGLVQRTFSGNAERRVAARALRQVGQAARTLSVKTTSSYFYFAIQIAFW
jgi:hypothetical protein